MKEVQSKFILENNNSNIEGGREGGRLVGGVDVFNFKYRKKNVLQIYFVYFFVGWIVVLVIVVVVIEMCFLESVKMCCQIMCYLYIYFYYFCVLVLVCFYNFVRVILLDYFVFLLMLFFNFSYVFLLDLCFEVILGWFFDWIYYFL